MRELAELTPTLDPIDQLESDIMPEAAKAVDKEFVVIWWEENRHLRTCNILYLRRNRYWVDACAGIARR